MSGERRHAGQAEPGLHEPSLRGEGLGTLLGPPAGRRTGTQIRRAAARSPVNRPLAYVARNLWVRRVTTLLTAGGMALVVFVYATVLMMGEGHRATLVATGRPTTCSSCAAAPAPDQQRHRAQPGGVVESLPGITATNGAGSAPGEQGASRAQRLPKARQRQTEQRHAARHERRSAWAAAAGAHGQGRMFRQGPRRSGRPRDRRGASGRRARRDAALASARLDGGRRVRLRPHVASTPRSGATPSR